ncbi:MAG: SelB C-terminal domain-containing protein [Limnochordaceae bacterium]|nr:SelB C-terminal domain-containing protein [Limnochordaceae bacterium]
MRLLGDAEELGPAETGLAQLFLAHPLPLRWRDRLILRDPGRQVTAAGGVVADPSADPLRGRRLVRQVAPPSGATCRTLHGASRPPADPGAMQALASGDVDGAVEALAATYGPLTAAELARRLHLTRTPVDEALARLAGSGRLVARGPFYLTPAMWERVAGAVHRTLGAYHRANPLSPGLPRQTLLSTLALEPRFFDVVLETLVRQGAVVWDNPTVRLPSFQPRLSPEDEKERHRLLELLERRGFTPPTLDELTRDQGFSLQLILLLVAQGELVRVHQDLVFTAARIRQLMEHVRAVARRSGGLVEPAAVRDALGSTRRFVIPLLEYLDRIGFTRRAGDRRQIVE